jgi:hypothetical protein
MSFAQAIAQAKASNASAAQEVSILAANTEDAMWIKALPSELAAEVWAAGKALTESLDQREAELQKQIGAIRLEKMEVLNPLALEKLDAALSYGEHPDFTSTRGAVFPMYVAAQMRFDLQKKSCTLGDALGMKDGETDGVFIGWEAKRDSKMTQSTKRALKVADKLELDALDEYFGGFESKGVGDVKLAGLRLAQLKRAKEKGISI